MKWDELITPPGACSIVTPIPQKLPRVWQSWLSENERKRLAAFGSEKRKREFLAGRVAARKLLADVLLCEPYEVDLFVEASGAVLVRDSEWRVSIAHSGQWAGAVCAQQAIGLDIERSRQRSSPAERFLIHPKDPVPHELERNEFTRLWVIKEAVLKARQSGLRMMASRLQVVSSELAEGTVVVAEPDGRIWKVVHGDYHGYPYAIAQHE